MDNELKKTHGRLILYIVVRLFYAQRWKKNKTPTMEKWIVKMSEFVGMAKPNCLVIEKKTMFFRKTENLI